DLNAASLKDTTDFFRTYYAPNNAALAVVGDFNTDQVLAKIKRYFESIPSQPSPPKVDTSEAPQTAERRFTVEDPLAGLPQIIVGFKGVVGNTPDFYAIQILNRALTGGQSSRLFQKLVKERELAVDVSGSISAMRGNGAYRITVTAAPGKKLEDIESAIYEEI